MCTCMSLSKVFAWFCWRKVQTKVEASVKKRRRGKRGSRGWVRVLRLSGHQERSGGGEKRERERERDRSVVEDLAFVHIRTSACRCAESVRGWRSGFFGEGHARSAEPELVFSGLDSRIASNSRAEMGRPRHLGAAIWRGRGRGRGLRGLARFSMRRGDLKQQK